MAVGTPMTSGGPQSWADVPCVNPREAPCVGEGHASAIRNDSLYIFGGRKGASVRNSSEGRPSNGFYEFNFNRNEWSVVLGNGSTPSPRTNHTAVVYNHSLFVFGGYDEDKRLNDFFEYNFLTQTWTNVFVNAGQQPTPRFGHAAVVYDNSMYCFGGNDNYYDRDSASGRRSNDLGRFDQGRHVNDLHAFNLETNSWALIATTGEIPSPREKASLVVHKRNCLLFGGYDHDFGYLNDVHVLDFDNRTWSSLVTKGLAPPGRHSPLAVTHSNSMYIFGGKTDQNFYELDLEVATWQPVVCNGAPPRSSHPVGCVHDGDLVIVTSDDHEVVSFKQFHLKEAKSEAEILDDVVPDGEDSAVAHLRSLVNNELLSDITFIVEGTQIFGHKNLCVRCNYFKAMFTGEMVESNAREVEIAGVSRNTFLSMLEYVYTDRLHVPSDSVKDVKELFVAADRFGIESLKRLCERKLLQSLSIDNVASILQAADQHSATALRDACFSFTLRNFDVVSKTESFQEMARTNIELALELLQHR